MIIKVTEVTQVTKVTLTYIPIAGGFNLQVSSKLRQLA